MLKPPQDHERLSKLASAFQSFVVGGAVLVGGLWTAYTFGALWSAEIAKISAVEAQDREGALELTMRALPKVAYITDSNSSLGDETALKAAVVLMIEVDINNLATRTHVVDLRRLPLKVKRIYQYRLGPNGARDDEPEIAWTTTDSTDEARVAPKTKMTLHFAIAVPNPGIYSVNFKTPTTNKSGNSLGRHSDPSPEAPETGRYWSVNSLVVVSPVDKSEYPALPESKSHIGTDGPLWKKSVKQNRLPPRKTAG